METVGFSSPFDRDNFPSRIRPSYLQCVDTVVAWSKTVIWSVEVIVHSIPKPKVVNTFYQFWGLNSHISLNLSGAIENERSNEGCHPLPKLELKSRSKWDACRATCSLMSHWPDSKKRKLQDCWQSTAAFKDGKPPDKAINNSWNCFKPYF